MSDVFSRIDVFPIALLNSYLEPMKKNANFQFNCK